MPDIDSDLGLMHTLFALEDTYGLRVEAADGEACLVVDASQGARAAGLREMLRAWREQAAELEAGEITRRNRTGGAIAILSLTPPERGIKYRPARS